MKRVFIHPLAGVLSAYGMGLADQMRRCARRRSSGALDDGLAARVATRRGAGRAKRAASCAHQGVRRGASRSRSGART